MGAHEEAESLLQDEEGMETGEEQRVPALALGAHTTSSKYWLGCMAIFLLCSVAVNVYQARSRHQGTYSRDYCQSPYSDLSFDTETIYQDHTKYQSENNSVADAHWDALDNGALAMAIPDEWAAQHGLPHSQRFPWDDGKGMYFVKALHQLHCLKTIRYNLINFYRYGKPANPEHHLMHCLDSLRQDVMCYADDTPMAIPPGHELGGNQRTTCRDWDAMIEWAQQPLFESCWAFKDEYLTIDHRIERYQFCRPDSKYFPIMQKYFQIHGHMQMYKENPV